MSVLLTNKRIETFKRDPILLAYESGYSQGFSDRSWDYKNPRVFTKDDCPSYRRGYRIGWATASSAYKNEDDGIDDSITDEQRSYWLNEELNIIVDWENKNAECDDEHCIRDEEARQSWLEVVECMEKTMKKTMEKTPRHSTEYDPNRDTFPF